MKICTCDICLKEVQEYDLTKLDKNFQIHGVKDICSKCSKRANKFFFKQRAEAMDEVNRLTRCYFIQMVENRRLKERMVK